MKIALWVLLIVLALYMIFVIGPSLVGFFMIFRRQPARDFEVTDMTGTPYEPYMPEILRTIRKMKEKPFEPVETRSHDGLLLRGSYLDAGSRKTAVCFHGYRAMPLGSFSGVGEYLSETEGFNLLLVEQRASNGSEGRFSSMGVLERQDALRWIKVAEEKGATEILLYGMSMGACTLGLCSDQIRDGKVKGIVLDAGFSSPRNQIIKQANVRKAPGVLMAPVVRVIGFLLFHGDLYDNVTNHLNKCDIPAVFLHSRVDDVVPPEDTEEAFEAMKAPKKKLITDKGGHTTVFYAENEKVREILHSFLKEYFE